MPIRQAGMLESRVSTWPRDHFCRSTIAPRPSRPTTWNEFLPISMPITAITLLSFSIMACSFHLAPPASLLADGRQEHGRTIPLAEVTRRKEVDSDRGTGSLNCSNRAAATELEPRREHAEFLMRELAHRGNNQLAVVKGMAVQNGGLWVQSPELELRDLPGDTPNRLRKARAKELSES